MRIIENGLYQEDIDRVSRLDLPWEKLAKQSVLISGATGMIGSFLIDVILLKNRRDGLGCRIYALGRSAERARERFSHCGDPAELTFIAHDINLPLRRRELGEIAYVVHLASNTHPVAYATDPVGTIATNIVGTNNLFEFSTEHQTKRFCFASSVEIYGENRGDVEKFDEGYLGYMDCNTLRAGYPESKRCGEALCQAYRCRTGIDVVIPRMARTYGPTMLKSDTKAISQFIKRGVAGEDIILKSEGTQFYSYTYVADAVSGLLTVLLRGESGAAYNIADEGSDITLRELAEMIAEISGTRVTFQLPDGAERAGYSRATKARMDGSRLAKLGWTPTYDMRSGIQRTIEILRSISE